MRKTVELLLLNNESEYRVEYVSTYVNRLDKLSIAGFPVTFSEKDFDHIFFEPKKGSGERVFSKRRARRMLFIEVLLKSEVKAELLYEPDTKNIAIFSQELEIVIYLRPIVPVREFQVVTFFDFGRDHTKMYLKQKRKCKEISEDQLNTLFTI